MSGLALTDLEDRATGDSAPVADVLDGFAKAWVKFNGTGVVAIDDDFNVSSITDRGTGLYTVNFANNMPSAEYAAISTVGGANAGAFSGAIIPEELGTEPSVSSFDIACTYTGTSTTNPSNIDMGNVFCAVFANV